jgi:hypothetical protein
MKIKEANERNSKERDYKDRKNKRTVKRKGIRKEEETWYLFITVFQFQHHRATELIL